MTTPGGPGTTVTTYPCPACLTPATLDGPCTGCGRAADPDAAEVAGIDARLAVLTVRIDTAHREIATMTAEFQTLDGRRRRLVHSINATLARGRAFGHPAAATHADAPAPADPFDTWRNIVPAGSDRLGAADTSPRTVQNLLFVFGGLLLGIGAIVFAVVAWVTYGVTGQAAILGTATAVAFAVPPLALRRHLVATAETFAVIALLLLTLDGYAIWRLDLFGAGHLPGGRYAALTCAVVAATAGGLASLTGLAGPRFAALATAQPVLPLAVTTPATTVAAWSGILSVIALADLLAAARAGRTPSAAGTPRAGGDAGTDGTAPDPGASAVAGRVRRAFGLVAGVLAGAALTAATWAALVCLLGLSRTPVPVAAAAATLAGAAVVLAVAGRLAASAGLRVAALAGATLEVVLIGIRVVTHLLPGQGPLAGAVILPAVAALAAALPTRVWCTRGVRLGTEVAVAVYAAWVGVLLLGATVGRAVRVAPLWHTDLSRLVARPVFATPWMPLAVVAVGASVMLLRRRWGVRPVAAVTVALLAPAVPVSTTLTWWAPPALDALAVVALAVAAGLALRRAGTVASPTAAVPADRASTDVPAGRVSTEPGVFAMLAGLLALALAGHATWLALARPVTTAAVLGGLVLLGSVLVLLVRPVAGRPVAAAFAGVSLSTALLALPGAVAATVAALPYGTVDVLRATMAAVLACLAVLPPVRRLRPELRWYAVVPLWFTATVPAYAALAARTSDRPVLYALAGLLVAFAAPLAVGVRGRAAAGVAAPAAVLTVVALLRIAPVTAALLLAPYRDLDAVWSGAPAGTGVPGHLDLLDVVAMLLAAAAYALGGLLVRDGRTAVRIAAGPVLVSVLVALAAAGAAWPTVPVVSVLAGAAVTVWWALALDGGAGRATGAAGVALLGAGVAGLLLTRAGTLGGLGAVAVTAAACAVGGRTQARRVAGWLGVVGFTGALAVVAPRAAGAVAGLAAVALAVVAALAVFGGAALGRVARRAAEARALEGAGHAAAFVALALSVSFAEAAALSSAWGVVAGIRALWPGLAARTRRTWVSVGAALQLVAWWLLAADLGVHRVDAYTVPLAAVGLLAGWLAVRTRPELRSWVAYGPGLLAGFVPALVPLLADAGPGRRVVVGLAALLVLLVGGAYRLQALVVIGGAALCVVALHELVLLWQALPTWAPLTAAGAVVLALAVTYERRRRDWLRLRGSIARMG